MRTSLLVSTLLVILAAISIDFTSTESGVKNKPKNELLKDDIHSEEVPDDLDFDRKKKPGRKSGKKKKGKGKKNKGKVSMRPFKEFRKTGLSNFENEIGSLRCSNLEVFQTSREGCGIKTWLKCLYTGYKYWTSCKKSCHGGKLCSLSCVKKKIEKDTSCKNCIKKLLKTICCHFIGGDCCIKANSGVTGDICCLMTDDQLISSIVKWPYCSNGRAECSTHHPCPPGKKCCHRWTPWPVGCCYRDTDECPPPIDSSITIMENGQELKQNTTVDSSSGLVTIDVPPHTTVLDQNFTKSTTMYNPATDISMTKSNSTCMLSDIPDGMNEYFQQLEKGTVSWGNKTMQTVYDVQKEDYVLGPKTRENLIPEMNNLCKNEIISKTETLKINETQYEKLVNGEIVLIENEQSTDNNNLRSCSLDASYVCSHLTEEDNCRYWTNPQTGEDIDLHYVSSRNLCTKCCNDKIAWCECNEQFEHYCPCRSITNTTTFYDCVFKNGTFKTIIENYVPLHLGGRRRRSADSDSSVIYQTLTYNSEVDERSVRMQVPAHGDLEETTVLMHANVDGKWKSGKNDMMLKLGSLCHVRKIPYPAIKPIEIAYNIKQINKGLDLENSTLTASNEIKKHFIISNNESLSVEEETSLNDEIKELCKTSKLIKYQEFEISEEEFQNLNSGGIINLGQERETEECDVQTKVTSVASGGWRWPKTKEESGTETMVNGLIQSVIQVDCCSKNSNHHSTYCDCKDIIDRTSFERCRPNMIAVIAGAHGFNLYDQFDSFKNDSSPGLQLEALPEKTPFPIKTKGGIGAYINDRLYVCQGYVQEDLLDGDGCFMMKIGSSSQTWTNINILTEPLKFGGAAAKYKSGPTGKEPGETWWIIGADYLGTATQEWNSVKGANPWDSPVLPLEIHIPCMAAISDREIFLTADPLYETVATNMAWIYSPDYIGTGWRTIPPLKEKRIAPACGFLPNDDLGFIVVAGGRDKSSTEYLDVTECIESDWDCEWKDGPDLGSNFNGASLVTMRKDNLVLVGDHTDILAINSTFQNWEVVGEMSQPRYDAVVLTVPIQ